MPAIAVIILALLVWLHPTAFAARPMITDDARIVDPGSCQLESWVKRNQSGHEVWALPGCNVTGNLELTAGGAKVNNGEGSASTTLVQAKTLFRPISSNGWGAGLTVGTVEYLPLARRSRDLYAYIPLSFSFADDAFVLHLNTGWLREAGRGTHRLTWGLGTELALSQRSWLIAEAFGQDQGRPFFQAGWRQWLVPDRVQLDATYGDRGGGGTGEKWFSLGVRFLSPKLF
ncbi:MAG: hypothetical protein Q7T64_00030 [Lacisediminimonas sp.]|nr:hypothetical protein [Lacisediminimonas sp.]